MKEKCDFLFDNKKPYQLRVENLLVEVKYGNNNQIEECLLNILKRKLSKKSGGEI